MVRILLVVRKLKILDLVSFLVAYNSCWLSSVQVSAYSTHLLQALQVIESLLGHDEAKARVAPSSRRNCGGLKSEIKKALI